MSTFLLVRHGNNDWLQGCRMAGRTPGVHLNAEGQLQAQAVASFLRQRSVSHVYTSPLERARETAEPLASASGLPAETSEALNEVDVGEWTGRSYEELDRLPGWRHWNTHRSLGWIPGGERMQEVQTRVVGEMERLRRRFPGDSLALFSHADPIRAALVSYLGMSLDHILRLEVSPGSVTELMVEDWGARLVSLNFRPLETAPLQVSLRPSITDPERTGD